MDDASDDQRLDPLAALITRRALAGFGGLLIALVAARLPHDTEARRRKKKKKKRPNNGPPPPPDGPGGGGGGGGGTLDDQEAALLTLINDYRTANGLRTLADNGLLDVAAKQHSQDMANRNYFDHNTPEGVTPQQRADQAGYRGSVGENIFAGGETAVQVFEAWKASPGHNANLLDPAYDAIGIGRAFREGSEYGWYWTAVFGTTQIRRGRPR